MDTGPLGLIANPFHVSREGDILQWIRAYVQAGNRLMVLVVADYELRRERVRRKNARALRLLDQFTAVVPDQYLPLSDESLQLAATLWADARNQGRPTADLRELDCDVLIAAQALSYDAAGLEVVGATSNLGHLSQYVQSAA